eukprot:scaffold80215_cov62-Phaeocystis_antarctica.AAC.6
MQRWGVSLNITIREVRLSLREPAQARRAQFERVVLKRHVLYEEPLDEREVEEKILPVLCHACRVSHHTTHQSLNLTEDYFHVIHTTPNRQESVLRNSDAGSGRCGLLGGEDELEQQLYDAEREADGVGAVDEDVLGGHNAVDGPQQGVGAPGR